MTAPVRLGRLIATGRTSDVHEFGPGLVAKVLRPEVPSGWAQMEATYTSAVRALGGPAPEIADVIEIEGRTAIVVERVQGQSMLELMVAEPTNAPALARQLAEVHHRLLCAGLPLDTPSLVERMSGKIRSAEQLSTDDREAACAVVDRLPKGAALLHGDLHPGNVLMAESGPIVIDWFDAAIGHPAADVVRSSLLMRPLGDDGDRPHLPGADRNLLHSVHDAYLGEMTGFIEADADDILAWERVVAASRLVERAEADEHALMAVLDPGSAEASSPLAVAW